MRPVWTHVLPNSGYVLGELRMGLLGTNIVETGLAQLIRNHLADKSVVPFSVRLPNGDTHRFGDGEPRFTVAIKDQKALPAIMRFDELGFTEAYINGSLDIEGDIWAVMICREILSDMRPLHSLWR